MPEELHLCININHEDICLTLSKELPPKLLDQEALEV